MGKKKKRNYQPQPPSRMFFTLSTVRLLKQALRTYERTLLQKPDTLPNISLAKEVVSQLKTKLEDMLQRKEWGKDTALYYNEVHILCTAVHMHLIDLYSSPQGEKVMEQYRRLYQQFSAIISSVDG
jgi:hypothetical protein